MDPTLFLTVCVVAVIFALIGLWVAGVKNRDGSEGCLLGCMLGPLGVIIEALLPTQPAPAPPGAPATPATPPELTRKCPDCAETIKAEAHVCRFCGARFSDEEVAAAVARASEAARAPTKELPPSDPNVCRFCGRDSRRNWHNAPAQICRDCAQSPEVQQRLHGGGTR